MGRETHSQSCAQPQGLGGGERSGTAQCYSLSPRLEKGLIRLPVLDGGGLAAMWPLQLRRKAGGFLIVAWGTLTMLAGPGGDRGSHSFPGLKKTTIVAPPFSCPFFHSINKLSGAPALCAGNSGLQDSPCPLTLSQRGSGCLAAKKPRTCTLIALQMKQH